MRIGSIIPVAAIASLAFTLFVPAAAKAEACCDKTTTNACSGSGFSQLVDTNQSMPNCGCSGDTPNFIGCKNNGGSFVICCMKKAPSEPETSGKLYVCKQVGTGKVLECAGSAGAACAGPAAQAACGFPTDPTKCIEEASGAKSCDEAKNPSAPKETAVPPKKQAAPIPPLSNPLGTTDISVILGRVVSAFLGIAGSVALLMFVYGGFTWITSGGSSERITKGKNTMIWATIGIAFIFSSYAMLSYLLRIFGKS